MSTVSSKIRQRLESLLTAKDENQVAHVGDVVRAVLEELAEERVIDPATIDRQVQEQLEEARAVLLMHRIAGDPTLCFVESLERDPARERVTARFSIPQWVVDRLDVLDGDRRDFEPQLPEKSDAG